MPEKLPFMNSTGMPPKILTTIISAQVPQIYNNDFQTKVLGYSGGSARPFIALLKKLGFISSTGEPTELYSQFRSESNRSQAMLQGLQNAYAPLFKKNEYAHKAPTKRLKEMVIEVTGRAETDKLVSTICNTFEALKTFVTKDIAVNQANHQLETVSNAEAEPQPASAPSIKSVEGKRLSISYTINLNLPSSKDPEVFNAIFESLRKTLLED